MKGISMIRARMAGVAVIVTVVVCAVSGQAAQPPARGAAKKPAVAAPRTSSARIAVRDQDGTSLSEVRLVLSGAGTGEFVTSGAGTVVVPDLKDGAYRLRCEREGFITLEREFTVRGGAYSQIDVVLNPAPPPPPPPAPEPAPAAVPSGGRPVTMSVVDYLDKNLIGREPLKESILACNPLETVRLLQMREGVAQHVHASGDEVIYVVAGEGTVRIGEAATPVRAGSLVVVTNGTGHAFERGGKNPLIVVSTLVGAPCDQAETQR
jgi:cupin superfamily acireductone dioxygenase involved in methionine salvage